MVELFKLSKDDIEIIASRDEKFETIAFLKITGKLIDTTLPVFLESMTILTNKHLVNVIIDCSDVMMIASSGWNAIIKKTTLFKDSSGSIVLIRLKPFVFSLYKELNLESQIPYYRTYGDAVAYINQHDVLPQNTETSPMPVELPHGVIEEEVLEKPTENTTEAASTDTESTTEPAQETDTDTVTNEDLQELAAHAEASVENSIEEDEIEQDESFPEEIITEESYPLNESRDSINDTPAVTEEDVESSLPIPKSVLPETSIVEEEEILPSPVTITRHIPHTKASDAQALTDVIEKACIELKIAGYDTSALDKALQGPDTMLLPAFNAYMNDINELRSLSERFNALDHSAFPKECALMRQYLHDPAQLENAKNQFNTIVELIEKRLHSAFNPLFEYSFDNFVKGECNKFAFDTALLISQGESVQAPVYIIGTNGTGKTHIVNAIGNRIMETSGRAVAYIPAEDFILSYENYQSVGALSLFREQYTGYDYLIIDDLQSFSSDKKAVTELKYLYEKSLASGKKIIFTSTHSPDALDNFGKDFISRLKSAITIKLSTPDGYTLSAIIKTKAAADNILLDDTVYPIIVRESQGDIRTALGILNTLKTYFNVYRQPLTALTACEALGIAEPAVESPIALPDDELLPVSQESFETETSELYTMEQDIAAPVETLATEMSATNSTSVDESVFTETDISSFETDTETVVFDAQPVETVDTTATSDETVSESELTDSASIEIETSESIDTTEITEQTDVISEEESSPVPVEESETTPKSESDAPVVTSDTIPVNNEQDISEETEFASSQSDESDFLQIDTDGTEDLWDDASDKTDDDPFKF